RLQLFRLDIARFLEAQERHALDDGKSQARGDGDEFLAVPRQRQPRLGQRTDEHFQHLPVHHMARICGNLRHQLSGTAPLPPPAISYSVMAISVSARSLSVCASSKTCF